MILAIIIVIAICIYEIVNRICEYKENINKEGNNKHD